ncbi:MAG TPA: hypothetical protein VIP98_18635 [Microlunatus sp.]
MAGTDRNAHPPRRGRGQDQGSEQSEAAATPPEQAGDAAEASTSDHGSAQQPEARSTEEAVAASRRAERITELRELRDSVTGKHGLPNKPDRPDVGHRRNVAEVDTETHRGRRVGLILGAVAIVIAAAVIAGFLTLGEDNTPVAKTQPTTTTTAPTSMISAQTMLSPKSLQQVVDETWKIDNDQPAGDENAPVPACLAGGSDDAPKPASAQVRTLTAGGSTDPTALHLAQAYKTPEDATEAFAMQSKALGECNLKGSYISDSRVITGLGDQATGIELSDDVKDSYRAVVLNRTGRMVNVVDVTQSKDTPDLSKTAEAVGDLTNSQCTIAVGVCASDPSITLGPPPIGGDQPGFLALADIPQPTNGKGTWGGLEPGSPADVTTSGCENVDFGTLQADNRTARSYVLTDKPKGMPKTFGLDQIVLSMRNEKDATSEVKRIVSNLKSCEDRLPTASVGGFTTVTGHGADATDISGTVALVNQKVSEDETSRYRVGVIAAGDKLVYTFLPRDGDWDFTKNQWETLAVRAGERATQVR